MLCAALTLFGLRVGHEPLWLDETYSFAMTEHGLFDVVRLTTNDVHPPLYYLLLKLFTLVFGDSSSALRLLSVLCATGLVALGAGPVRRVWNTRTGWLFAALALSSSGILCFAQEARMYALATLLVTSAVLYGQLALRDGRRTDFVAFGVFTWAASLTHYFALVAVGFNAALLLFAAGLREPKRLRSLGLSVSLAAMGFAPWAPFFMQQVRAVTNEFWIPPTSLDLFVFGLVAPFSYKTEDIPYPWQALAALLVTVLVVAASLLVERWRARRSEVTATVQLLLVFGLTLGFGLLFSFLVRPIFMPRYMMVCAGLLLLVLSAGLARLPKQAALALTALLVALGLPAWWRVQTQTFSGPFDHLARHVASAGEPRPVLLHNGFPFSFALLPSAHAVPGARHVVLVPAGAHFDATGGGLYVSDVAEVIHHVDELHDVARLWVVDGMPGPDPSDVTSIESNPRWQKVGDDLTLEEPMSWVKLRVRRFETAPTLSVL